MTSDFEPLEFEQKPTGFSAWEMSKLVNEGQIKVSEKDKLESEKARLVEEAIEKGYQEGLRRANEEIMASQAALSHWINLLQKPVTLIDDKLTQELIQTVIWLCEHCIGVTIKSNPEQLQAIVDTIKDELPSITGNKTLLMHPEDLTWLKSKIDTNGLSAVLVEDPALSRGDFYIKGEHTELDGCLKTRLTTLFGKYIDDPL